MIFDHSFKFGRGFQLNGIVDPIEYGIIKYFGNKNFIAVDVGASNGFYSLALRSYFKKVHSFEPDKQSFKSLKNNIALNNLEDDLIANNFGLYSHNGFIDFENMKINLNVDNCNKIKVESLDNYLAPFIEKSKERIGLIKVDIEGFELEFIQGAIDSIRLNKPIIILEMSIYESSKQKCRDTVNLMKDLGYDIFQIPYFYKNKGNKKIKPITNKINILTSNSLNYLFLPKELVFDLQKLNNSLVKNKNFIFYQS